MFYFKSVSIIILDVATGSGLGTEGENWTNSTIYM